MLGAKARAAEYNAAKAASARRACREIEEQKDPPIPAAQPLSVFARHASASRNKSHKMWKPLVISEDTEDSEEPRSMSSADLVGGSYNSSPAMQDLAEQRPSSLPSRPMIARARPEFLHNISNSYLGLYGVTPSGPRAMQHTDLAYLHSPMTQDQMLDYQIPLTHNIPCHRLAPYSTMPTPQLGWVAPAEINDMRQQTRTADVISHTPLSGQLVDGMSNRPRSSEVKVDVPNFETTASRTPRKPDGVQDEATVHIYGPDDLSPSKMETKTARRLQCLETEKQKQRHMQVLSVEDQVSTSSSLDVQIGDSPLQQRKQLALAQRHVLRPKPQRQEQIVTVIQERQDRLLTEIAIGDLDTVRGRPVEFEDQPLQAITKTRHLTEIALPPSAEFKSPHMLTSAFNSPHQLKRRTTKLSPDATDKELFKGNIRQHSSRCVTQQTLRIPPPPGLEHMTAFAKDQHSLAACMDKKAEKQCTDILFPLADMQCEEWLEIRLPTAAEREKLQRVMKTVAACMSSSNCDGVDRFVFENNAWKHWIKQRAQIKEMRQIHIDHLVDEMQQKWQRSDQYRGSMMTEPEAKKAALAVKAIGNMMANLQQHTEDVRAGLGGSVRPYDAAPEYAIEHSIQLGCNSEMSLFETESVDGQSAPRRIARDPRFRNMLGTRGVGDRAPEAK